MKYYLLYILIYKSKLSKVFTRALGGKKIR